ncbi:MAG: DUF262 domain-containing protein, partial [Carnobacterium sp.]|nr:DUF262 domain-containing protein [Carnobacterium sp.]
MSRGFQPEITIREAIDSIDSNKFLLPAIQRKFVWSTDQIELLFDSVMRSYPINSLMLWEINSESIKNNYKFYSFLRKYIQKYGEMNEALNTRGKNENFYAIIDGQQRLNSLYIGLKGTYALKLPHKHLNYTEDNFPPMKLYLNIKSKYESDTEIDKKYEFKFLKDEKATNENSQKDKYWYEVGNILTMEKPKDQYIFLQKSGLGENDYAQDTLDLLSTVINKDKLLNYFVEDEQNPDKVLDIFIRTNDGGTKLTFSDLLMSVLTANWLDAREKFDDLIKDVNQFGDFSINTDLILKTALVLYSDDIKNRVKNFDNATVKSIIENWGRIRKSILNTFELFYRLGFNNKTFPAKNAAIPIIAWVYKNNKEEIIIKNIFYESKDDDSDHRKIKKWLTLVFLKRIFGGQSDTVLLDIKRVINAESNASFPLKQIMESAKRNPIKNYSFDNEFIDGLFESKCGSENAAFVLSLFYPDLDYYNQNFHIDHIHPKTKFINIEFAATIFTDDELNENRDNWNKIGNLQLLNSEKN